MSELWNTHRVAKELGIALGSVRQTMRRADILPQGRESGRKGTSLYPADAVTRFKRDRPGRGHKATPTQTGAAMRIIHSTSRPATVKAEQARTLLEEIHLRLRVDSPVRESYTPDEIGQPAYHALVIPYCTPEDKQRRDVRWAVSASDPNSAETVDFKDREAAERYYEEQVRLLAGCAAPGDEPWWYSTDVDGVPERS